MSLETASTDGARDPDLAPLSVVVGTTQEWPELEYCLLGFLDEARALGAEVIVLDRDGRGLPASAAERYPRLIRISEPGASIYRMRSLGMARARGEVVLTTEDHCRPRPGWCTGHLRAHRQHPQVAVVGGPVDNGARRRLIDWASFLLGHAGTAPPLAGGERKALDRSNVSYKRRVLPRAPSPAGKDDPPLDQWLAARGERFHVQPDAIVDHRQSIGFLPTLAIHYHNGRAVAGLRLERGMRTVERIARVVASVAAGPAFLARTVATVLGRRASFPGRAFASLPLVAVITTLVGAGLFVGFLAGPGRSAQQLR